MNVTKPTNKYSYFFEMVKPKREKERKQCVNER